MSITFTQGAQAFMRRMVKFGGMGAHAGFRLSVTPGGCTGAVAAFSVESAALPGDDAIELDGLKVYLPAGNRQLLDGGTVDFRDTLSSSGLDVRLATGACGACSPNTGATAVEVKIDAVRIAQRR